MTISNASSGWGAIMWAAIFAAGYSAHDDAIPRNANPFPRDNEQCHKVWESGWDQSATNRQILRWSASPLSKLNTDENQQVEGSSSRIA